VLAVVGPSGAGKSTLVNSFLAFRCHLGRIAIDGTMSRLHARFAATAGCQVTQETILFNDTVRTTSLWPADVKIAV